jgi:hypothetical protein
MTLFTVGDLEARIEAAWLAPSAGIKTVLDAHGHAFDHDIESSIRWYVASIRDFEHCADFFLRCEGLLYDDYIVRGDGSPLFGAAGLEPHEIASPAFEAYRRSMICLRPNAVPEARAAELVGSPLGQLHCNPGFKTVTPIIDALHVRNEWNQQTIVWATSNEWGFFNWQTSA